MAVIRYDYIAMTMQILTEAELDIGGFAGVRERVYVQDERALGDNRSDGAINGLGAFVYLADASLLPHRRTGLHHHRNIDIITVVLNGRLLHRGSMGEETLLSVGDVQIQRAGQQGFSHDEINPDATFNRFLQLWVRPRVAASTASYTTLRTAADTSTLLLESEPDSGDARTRISLWRAAPGATETLNGKCQLLIASGRVSIHDGAKQQFEGVHALITAEAPVLHALEETWVLMVTHGAGASKH